MAPMKNPEHARLQAIECLKLAHLMSNRIDREALNAQAVEYTNYAEALEDEAAELEEHPRACRLVRSTYPPE